MKTIIYDLNGEKKKEINLPEQFNENYNYDLIKRAVLAIRSRIRQPYGAYKEAGKRQSTYLSKRRRNYRGVYGHGISRMPKKVMWRRGTQFGWVGAFAPGTVGGRKAHPPKAEKIWEQKINKKEANKALRSALAATINKELVKKRNHIIPDKYPLVIENKIEELKKTKEAKQVLEKLGLKKELERVKEKKIRAGKGKLRGRKYKRKIGPLIVVSKSCSLMKAARNIAGVNIVPVDKLNVDLLSPGADGARLTIYTDNAIERLEKENLYK